MKFFHVYNDVNLEGEKTPCRFPFICLLFCSKGR